MTPLLWGVWDWPTWAKLLGLAVLFLVVAVAATEGGEGGWLW